MWQVNQTHLTFKTKGGVIQSSKLIKKIGCWFQIKTISSQHWRFMLGKESAFLRKE